MGKNYCKYNWNPVYNFVIGLKEKYEYENGKITSYDYEVNCIEYWATHVSNPLYSDIIKYIDITQYGTLCLFRYKGYDELFSDSDFDFESFWNLYDGFYRNCRSIVIDVKDEEIVICPFDKFFNVGELHDNDISSLIKRIEENDDQYEVTEKKDGSMQCVSYYHNKFMMCGSQALDKSKSWRLEDGYRMLNEDKALCNLIVQNPEKTFIFEYISIRDAHVVRYQPEEEGLYLIGIRDNCDGTLFSYDFVTNIAKKFNVKTIGIYKKSIDDILYDMKTYPCNEMEGYVIRVKDYMCKIKTDDYVEMHKILSKYASINMVIKSIADGIWDDFIAKIPLSKKEFVIDISKTVFEYIQKTDRIVNEYFEDAKSLHGNSKKEFMKYVSDCVPKQYRGYVINKYLGRDNNYIKSINGRYKKIKEIS